MPMPSAQSSRQQAGSYKATNKIRYIAKEDKSPQETCNSQQGSTQKNHEMSPNYTHNYKTHCPQPRAANPKNNVNQNLNQKHRPRARQEQKVQRRLVPNNPEKLKMEMCRNIVENGYCRYENLCKFAHSVSEIKENNFTLQEKYKSRKCKVFFDKQYCRFGIRCNFKHQHSDVEYIVEESKKSIKQTIHNNYDEFLEMTIEIAIEKLALSKNNSRLFG